MKALFTDLAFDDLIRCLAVLFAKAALKPGACVHFDIPSQDGKSDQNSYIWGFEATLSLRTSAVSKFPITCQTLGYSIGEIFVTALTFPQIIGAWQFQVASVSFLVVLFNRLDKYIEDNELIYPEQIGFRKKCRTSDSILTLKTLINKAFKSKQYLFSCFEDLSKAFDMVSRVALLFKLEQYNITGLFVFQYY